MAYTTIDKSTNFFETKLWTGNGSSQNITGLDFAPNWVWAKSRSDARQHALVDTVRGVNQEIASNLSAAEFTAGGTGSITAFTSDGFSLGGSGDVNNDGSTFVSWNWKAGTSFTNDASSTSVGTIDSAGSVSDISGFSIVSYTGTGSAGTVKHGLSTAPSTIYVKRRSGGSESWTSFHKPLGNDGRLIFNATDGAGSSSSYWNSTAPTSSVFSIGTNDGTNTDGATYIAYCIANIKGYSHSGSYTANGNANGPFVYTGFKPAFLIVKRSSAAEDWEILDNKRLGYNGANKQVRPNTNAAENDYAPTDFVSNGIKFRSGNQSINGSGTFIFTAFAESPFVTSSGVPTPAR